MNTNSESTESFYTIAIYESQYWDSATLKKHGIKAAFGLYLFREGEATHCCSLTPASWCEWMQNAFIFEDNATDAQRESAQELEYDNGGESGQYVTPLRDPAKLDARFIAGPLVLDATDVDPRDHNAESYHPALWEAARESWGCSPDEPVIISNGDFDEWRRDKRA